ncbi:hypothetical protein [Pseudogulbenkiania sp. MAI-1]|uniref:hypothetical protein n=1 Tax=Pseudogulbenkiania sp. MAI-1 TaxID=990370 RepID=UPI00045EA146|nr:hypothetical protein [Pseudogulbenkiania sp. MAI-1]
MRQRIERAAVLVMLVSLLVFGLGVYAAYFREQDVAMPLLIAAHLSLTIAAGLFKVGAVVLMACRKARLAL